MTADAITSALKAGGWSLAEYATDLGHVAEAYRGDRRVSVAAPSVTLAWQVLWARVTRGGRAFGD